MDTNLREGKALVTAEGILQENSLKLEKADGVSQIVGNIVLKVSDTNSITFNVRQSEKTKSGTDNKAFPGLMTVMTEYKAIANVGEEHADRVRVSNGQIRPAYMARNDREGIFYQSNFFNRVNTDDAQPGHAEFEIELYVESVVPEVYRSGEHQGEETGRALVKGWLPTYSGIEPVTLIAPKEDGIAESVMELYTPGTTGTFYGDIVNSRIVKTSVAPVRIGKPKETTSVSYINELVITGATEPYDEENKNAFNKDAVMLAIKEREALNEEKRQRSNNGNGGNNSRSYNPNNDTGFLPNPSSRKLPF